MGGRFWNGVKLIDSNLNDLETRTPDQIVRECFQKFRRMRKWEQLTEKAAGMS